MERPAKPWGDALRAWAAWLIVGLVAWRAVEGSREALNELTRKPWREHVRAVHARPEALVARRLGPDVRILVALRTHAPAGSVVRVSFAHRPDERRTLKNRLMKLGALAYPVRLDAWPLDPRSAAPRGPLVPGQEGLVLDLASGRDFSVWPVCVALAEGPGWRLLRVGTGAG